MNKIYVIMERAGNYEISYIKPVGFVNTKEDADNFISDLTEKHRHICDIAIKNTYDELDSREYSKLLEEFDDYIMKTYFPQHENYDTLNEEELIKYNSLYGNDICDSPTFKEWCKKVKGLSEDVIEATAIYNEYYDYDTIHYYIEEVVHI